MFSPTHNIFELMVAYYYYRKYGEPVFLPVGYFTQHDGTVFNGRFDRRYEVKFDAYASLSNNLALEISCRGTPSGLASTKAFDWVHGVPVNKDVVKCFELPVPALRDLTCGIKTVWGGDYHESEMKLVAIDKVLPYATDVFSLTFPWDEIGPYWDNLWQRRLKERK